jgi:hypothetical protein
MGTENRKTVAIALAAFLVAVLGLTAACTPEEQRRGQEIDNDDISLVSENYKNWIKNNA